MLTSLLTETDLQSFGPQTTSKNSLGQGPKKRLLYLTYTSSDLMARKIKLKIEVFYRHVLSCQYISAAYRRFPYVSKSVRQYRTRSCLFLRWRWPCISKQQAPDINLKVGLMQFCTDVQKCIFDSGLWIRAFIFQKF